MGLHNFCGKTDRVQSLAAATILANSSLIISHESHARKLKCSKARVLPVEPDQSWSGGLAILSFSESGAVFPQARMHRFDSSLTFGRSASRRHA